MGLLRLLVFAPVLINALTVQVNWLTSNKNGVIIRALAHEERINQCLQGGLQLRFKFQTKLCYRRGFWYDACGSERIEVRGVSFDPIKEEYNMTRDVHHDVEPPAITTVKSAQEALEQISAVRALSVDELDGVSNLGWDRKGAYLGVRVVVECRGESGGFFDVIPYVLSFGMINSSISDSGWVGFDVTR